jgi:hypothetical protein
VANEIIILGRDGMVKQIECEDAEASKENKMLKCEEEEDYFLSVIHSHCLGL